MKSPGYNRLLQWISEAWSNLVSSTITESFISCGIVQTDEKKYHKALDLYLTQQINDYVEEINDDDNDDFECLFHYNDEEVPDSEEETCEISEEETSNDEYDDDNDNDVDD